ncbi:hypothetical protein [uncultured Tateyamaria sp.]|uniref:hypothetical protein n=1 Tax=uncultured Tateyamaria sp. TaxID=455651 RepID=UPI00260385D9|nr:hypothetical protein [uncultured Tateyamaria sp.]
MDRAEKSDLPKLRITGWSAEENETTMKEVRLYAEKLDAYIAKHAPDLKAEHLGDMLEPDNYPDGPEDRPWVIQPDTAAPDHPSTGSSPIPWIIKPDTAPPTLSLSMLSDTENEELGRGIRDAVVATEGDPHAWGIIAVTSATALGAIIGWKLAGSEVDIPDDFDQFD